MEQSPELLIVPLGKHVLVSPIEPDKQTASGLIIPDSARKDLNEGVVLAAGPRVEDVKAGDRVVYTRFAGITTKAKGDKVELLILEDDVLAVSVPAAADHLIYSFEHEGWWAPDSNGYTADMRNAGLYTRAEAERIVEKANCALAPGQVPNEACVKAPDWFLEAHKMLAEAMA